MKALLTLLLMLVVTSSTVAATYYVAVNDGLWSSASTWSSTYNGAGGAGIPTSLDDVRTNGRSVIVDGNYTIRNLIVTAGVANSIKYDVDNGFEAYTLTITGSLIGSSGDFTIGNGTLTKPTTTVIQLNSDLNFRFTGANSPSAIIRNWSHSAPLPRVIIDAPSLIVNNQDNIGGQTGGEFSVRYSLAINNGTFQPFENVGDYASSALLTVASGATLDLSQGSISGDGSNATLFNNATISGVVNISGAQYLNLNNLTLDVSGDLNVNSTGAGQTQGWWYQSNSPLGTVSLNGDVTYGASGNQNISSRTYSNLILAGSGTKSAGSGSLIVNGTLTINSGVTLNANSTTEVTLKSNVVNSGNYSTTQLTNFEANGTQTLSGTGYVFGSVDVGDGITTTTLSIQDPITVNGNLRIFGSAVLEMTDNSVTLGGNLTKNGSITTNGSPLAEIIFTGGTVSAPRTISGTNPISLPGIQAATSSFVTAAGTTLTINGNVTLSGTFTAGTTQTITGDLTVNSGGSYSSSGTLNIAGDVSAGGTTSITTINFNGTTGQSISGSMSATNLLVASGANVSNNGAISISSSGRVALSGTGVFYAGAGGSNTLTLLSTGLTSTARIDELPNSDLFSGNVTVQRLINTPEDYRYLSFPVSGVSAGMLKDDIAVTGNFTDPTASGGNVVDNTAANIYWFNSGTQTWTAVGSGTSTDLTPLPNQTGFSIWSYVGANTVIDVNGEINAGPVMLTTNTGDNLLPNPYPSSIDWDDVDLGSASLTTNAVYLRTAFGTYATYVQGAGTSTGHPLGAGWTGEIAIGQSYWVVANGSGSIFYEEADKTNNTRFVRKKTAKDYVRIRLMRDSLSDDVIVQFREEATLDRDVRFDAIKKQNDIAFNLSTYNTDPSIDFAINGVPYLSNCTFSTHLKLGNSNTTGMYSLSFEDLSTLQAGYTLKLVDHFLESEILVNDMMDYDFEITTDPNSGGADRFELVFSRVSNATVISEGTSCGTGSVSLTVGGAPEGGSYKWYSDPDGVTPIAEVSGVEFVTPELSETQTYYVAVVDAGGCESLARTEVQAKIIQLPTPEVQLDGEVISTAPDQGEYQWYLNGEPIEGATDEAFTPTTPGLYTVTVTDEGCTATSSAREFIISSTESAYAVPYFALPNPVDDELVVSGADIERSSIALVDLLGRSAIIDGHYEYRNDEKVFVSDVAGFKTGIYVLRISNRFGTSQLKIFKR